MHSVSDSGRQVRSRLRLAGLLIISAPVLFILTIVWSLVTGESVRVPADQATIENAVAAVAPYRGSWVLTWIGSFAGILALNLGLILLATVLANTRARYLAWVGLISAVGSAAVWAFLAYLNIGLVADVAHLPPFVASQSVSQIGALIGHPFERTAGLLLCLSATVVSIGLFLAGALRWTALVVGVLNGLVLLANVAGIGLPPIVSLLLTLPLGIGLLRSAPLSFDPETDTLTRTTGMTS